MSEMQRAFIEVERTDAGFAVTVAVWADSPSDAIVAAMQTAISIAGSDFASALPYARNSCSACGLEEHQADQDHPAAGLTTGE